MTNNSSESNKNTDSDTPRTDADIERVQGECPAMEDYSLEDLGLNNMNIEEFLNTEAFNEAVKQLSDKWTEDLVKAELYYKKDIDEGILESCKGTDDAIREEIIKHIENINQVPKQKMTTDTPRTDAVKFKYKEKFAPRLFEFFSKQLERELAASKAEVERLNGLLSDLLILTDKHYWNSTNYNQIKESHHAYK